MPERHLSKLHQETKEVTEIILKAGEKARRETDAEPEPHLTKPAEWPISCTVGPGLEGAIACETTVGYVNGAKGWLIYRGYDIFDLCAYSSFAEVSYLLLHGSLPTTKQLGIFRKRLVKSMHIPETARLIMNYPIQDMTPMVALRLGVDLLHMKPRYLSSGATDAARTSKTIGTDEDSIPMETPPLGEAHAVYEIPEKQRRKKKIQTDELPDEDRFGVCYDLIAGVGAITSIVSRTRQNKMPLEPCEDLSFAANLLYMMTGKKPTPLEERVMDISLILHADHGMNASTFASMVVASTLADIYFSVGTGVSALSGSLHGGANEQVLYMLEEIGGPEKVKEWYAKAREDKRKIMGFGHRVYKAYDPRARILGPLADFVAKGNKEVQPLIKTAHALEKEVARTLGAEKAIFPNVDFYSGLVYKAMGIPPEFFTPLFAVSRVSGWTARVMEYLQNNRIFRPRAMYIGKFGARMKRD